MDNKEEQKLPRRFKKKWLKALRSGKYKQGMGKLVNNEKYCCLGIACIAAGYKDEDFIKETSGEGADYIHNMKTPLINVPDVLQGSKGIAQMLASMNDEGEDFNQIADYIEKNL